MTQIKRYSGRIVRIIKNALFNVKLDNGHEVKATISRKIHKKRIRILLGDRVTCEMPVFPIPTDLSQLTFDIISREG